MNISKQRQLNEEVIEVKKKHYKFSKKKNELKLLVLKYSFRLKLSSILIIQITDKKVTNSKCLNILILYLITNIHVYKTYTRYEWISALPNISLVFVDTRKRVIFKGRQKCKCKRQWRWKVSWSKQRGKIEPKVK